MDKEFRKLLDLLIETIPYVEEGETFEKPDHKRGSIPKLSTRIRKVIREHDPEAGA